jgi:hypothetical protein
MIANWNWNSRMSSRVNSKTRVAEKAKIFSVTLLTSPAACSARAKTNSKANLRTNLKRKMKSRVKAFWATCSAKAKIMAKVRMSTKTRVNSSSGPS